MTADPTADKVLFVAVGALELATAKHSATPRCDYCGAWIVDGPGLREGSSTYCDSFCYHDAGPELLADDYAEQAVDDWELQAERDAPDYGFDNESDGF